MIYFLQCKLLDSRYWFQGFAGLVYQVMVLLHSDEVKQEKVCTTEKTPKKHCYI